MGDKSAIEWTDATWNVVTGCTKVSPGCANCYIERTPPFRMAGRKFVNGDIPLILHEDRLVRPYHWKRPRRIFVNSLSDLFHEDLSFDFIAKVYVAMMEANWHQYQVLTKRHARAVDFYRWLAEQTWLASTTVAPPHIWFGMTAENSRFVQERGDALLSIDAGVRWLSLEPILEDVSVALRELLQRAEGRIHWIVSGFESGPRRRPDVIMPEHQDWMRRHRDICAEFGVPWLFKQWGGPSAKTGGRILDGRTYDGYPVV